MKRILFLSLVALSCVWGGRATAAPCASAALSSYTALGSTGCTIGDLTFSDFVLRDPQSGAIASTSITVTPLMNGASIVGLQFFVSPTASNGNFYDDLITYRVSSATANVVGSTVDFTGTSATGDAAVSVAENLCLAGSFGPDGVSGCSSGNTLNLAVVDVGFGPDPAYTLTFAGVGSLGVATDIAFDSGSGFVPDSGSTLTSAINLFSVAAIQVVPEPSLTALLGLGLFGILLSSRRRSHR